MLTAIAIPVFTSQLEKSREASDIANLRSAYAEQMTWILTWDGTSAPNPLTVKAQQTQANWQTNGEETYTIAGGIEGKGIDVSAKTIGSSGSWTVTVNTSGAEPVVTIS